MAEPGWRREIKARLMEFLTPSASPTAASTSPVAGSMQTRAPCSLGERRRTPSRRTCSAFFCRSRSRAAITSIPPSSTTSIPRRPISWFRICARYWGACPKGRGPAPCVWSASLRLGVMSFRSNMRLRTSSRRITTLARLSEGIVAAWILGHTRQ